MKRTLIAAALAISAAFAGPVQAENRPISLSSTAQLVRIVAENGEQHETLVKPEGVVPGDKLVFTTTFTNSSADNVSNFVLVNPIPKDMSLTEGDLEQATYSVDGGKTFAALDQLTVADKAGTTRPATLADVTHLRWTIKQIAPKTSGSVQFTAVVR